MQTRSHNHLTDQIRLLLQADDQRLSDEMRRLAGEYAEACRAANERLRRCMALIRQGLRTEAVHLAEADPPITDLVNELDLAELQPAWEELCSFYDLPRPEPLRLELAEAINETYAELEPLAAMLSRHRRLALGRAPLPLRIATLRELVEADTLTPFWEEDLRTFERYRLREIEGEARNAARARDAATLRTLAEEVSSPLWLEPPSGDLQKKVKNYARQIQQGSAREELVELEPQLQQAFAALDLAAGRPLRDRWTAAAAKAKLPPDDPLIEQVAPVLGWLADEEAREQQDQAFRGAVADLENAVEHDDVELPDLERKAHIAARFDRELPAALVAAYRNRKASLEAGAKRRRVAIAAAASAALLLVVGFVGLMVWRVGLDQQIEQLAGEVSELVGMGKLAEARTLFDEHRDISTKELWLNTRRTLQDAERSEAERQVEYAAAFDAASAARSAAEAAPHLKIARTKASKADEKIAVSRLEREWQDRRNTDLAKNEERFRAAAQTAADLLSRFEGSLRSGQSDQVRSLQREAAAAVAELGPLVATVRPEVAGERDVLVAKLTALEESFREREDHQRLMKQMTAAVGSGDSVKTIDDYVAAAEAYRQRFPMEPRAIEIGESLAESDSWRAVLRWSGLARNWSSVRPSDADLPIRLRQVETYLAANPSSPTLNSAQQYAEFLRSLAERTADEGVNARLQELARAPLIGGPLHVVRTKGRAYYLTKPEDFRTAITATVRYIVGTDPSRDTDSKLLKKNELDSLQTEPAPQVGFADQVLRSLPATAGSAWDQYLLKLIKQIRDDEKYDPFVKHLILVELLAAAADGNIFLATTLQEVRSRLEDQEIDPAARWMDPDDEDAAVSRQRADAAVKRVQSYELETAWQSAADLEQKLEQQLRQSPRLVGWLNREENEWRVSGAAPEKPITVHVAASGSGGGTWETIGSLAPDRQALAGPGLKQGRLVFTFGDASGDQSASLTPQNASR